MAIRFVWEIIALIIYSIWGYGKAKWLGAILTPFLVATIWALFGSPAATYKLDGIYKIGLELSIFFVAAYLLFKLQHLSLAVAYGSIALFISILIIWLKI